MKLLGLDWDTLEVTEIVRSAKLYPAAREFQIRECFVWTPAGTRVLLWKVLNPKYDCEALNCIGFTLRTYEAPLGPYWINWFNNDIEKNNESVIRILIDGFRTLNKGEVPEPGDIVGWGNEKRLEHLAPLRLVVSFKDGTISEESRVDHKNGTEPLIPMVPLSSFKFGGGFRRFFWREK